MDYPDAADDYFLILVDHCYDESEPYPIDILCKGEK